MDDVVAIGGRLFSGVREISSDLSVLDRSGTWVVVLPFQGQPLCARFHSVRPLRPGRRATDPSAGIINGSRGRSGPWSTSLDRLGHARAVEEIRRRIARGEVYEVNLCRILSTPWPPGAGVLALGRTLGARHPAPYAATVQLPSAGRLLVSASPELFLRRQGDLVESRPIKGTAARPDGFLDKDRAENVMITDLVRNDLGRVCRFGSVTVPSLCRVEAHPGLFHLVTTVRGRLRTEVTWPELLSATFPPGSVTGAPKLAALDAIRHLEPASRGVYCGAIGWVDADRKLAELAVAIRTFEVADGRLCYGTGGAVTWGSSAAGEWAETQLKAAGPLSSLGSPHWDSSAEPVTARLAPVR